MMPSGKPVCIALNGPSFYRKNVDLSGIQTRILGLKGEHADYYEQFTTTAWEGVQIVQMDPFFNIFTCKHSNFFERPKINEMRMGVAHKYFYFHIWQRQANLFFSSVASNLTRIFFVKITFYESLELALMGKMFRCLRMFFQPKKCKNRESEYLRVKWTQIQIFDLNFLLWIKFEWKWWNVFGRRRPNGFGKVRAWDFSSIEVSLQ